MSESEHKVALVTGCSSGIGKSTALMLARAGFYTFASMRDVSKGYELKDLASKENLPLEIINITP
jgi:NAD(P)-dependent dehydrogenase (short-subunit alcohol dehydrogenase family)